MIVLYIEKETKLKPTFEELVGTSLISSSKRIKRYYRKYKSIQIIEYLHILEK